MKVWSKKPQSAQNCRLKLCVAFSTGGHFAESMQLVNCLQGFDVFYVAPKAVTTKNLIKIYFLSDSCQLGGIILSMILNAIISSRIVLLEHPDVIITTGAEIVIPLCYIAKMLLGTKIIFIETFARVNSPSFTGRVLYPISDIFLVQWESLLKHYRDKAKYVGRVF